MADVYRIQAVINIGGNIAPELNKILKSLDRTEKDLQGLGKGIAKWSGPIDRAATAMGRFSREMAAARRGASTVERELGRIRSGMAGLKAPAGGLDREMQKWATALGRPLAEMGKMRSTTQGVGSAARGVSQSIDSWASRISKATSAMQRMQRVAANTHLPNLPNAGGSLGSRGTGTGGGGASAHGRRRGRGGHGGRHGAFHHEGSAVAGLIGVGGGIHTLSEVVETGVDMRHIELGMRQTGASDEQVKHARETAYAGSQKFPNLSPLEIFEHINDLRGILGDMDKAIHEAPDLLPEFSALKAKAGNHGAKSAINEIYTAVKSAETANEITAEGVQKHANSLMRLSFWYGDKLNPSNYFTAQKNGGQMLNLTSDRFRYGAFAALTQEIGQRAGTQFSTYAAKGVAGLRMMESGRDLANKYGLLDPSTVRLNKKGHVLPGAQFDNVGLDGKIYDRAKDPDLYLYNNIIPKLKKGGVNTDDNTELLRVLGGIYTDKLAYGFLFELAKQRSKIEKDYAGFEKTSGDTANYRKNDPYAAMQGTKAQGGAIATALSEPAVENIVNLLNRLNGALGGVAKTLEEHPVAANAAFSGGTALVGGAAAAGAAALTIAAVGTLSLPALAVGAVAALTIGALTIPWDAIKQSIFGIEPGQGTGRDAHLSSMRRTAALQKSIGPRDFSQNRFGTLGMPDGPVVGGKVMPNLPEAHAASLWERLGSYGRGGAKRAPQAPSMFDTVPSLPDAPAWKSATEGAGGGGAPAAIKQAGEAIGHAGSAATTAAPSIEGSAAGFNKAAEGAKSAAGAADAAGGALAGLAAKISALGSISLPGATKAVGGVPAVGGAPASGGGGAAPATPGKTSVIYRGGAAPIHVATAVQLDGRTVGRAVTKHQVASMDTRNGLGRFDDNGLKTPVGFSEPVTA